MKDNIAQNRFTIISIKPEYQPLRWNNVELITDDAVKTSSNSDRTSDRIYISADGWEKIAAHIGWGLHEDFNSVEQGGLLLGRAYYSEEPAGLIYGIVEKTIAAYSAEGSTAYLKIRHLTWKTMMDEFDELTSQEEWADLQIIGWYHTHPGRLSVFMSGTDMNSQQRMFSKDWQFAIVLNPQKKIWRAFRGANAMECEGEIIKRTENGNTI